MIDGKAAVIIGSALAGAIAFWAAVYGWGKWLNRPRIGRGAEPADADARLQRMEAAIDAIANEVERLGEGQRSGARLLAQREQRDRIALPLEGGNKPMVTPH
jgi:hypothetical protein